MKVVSFSSVKSDQGKCDKFIADFGRVPEQVIKGKYRIALLPGDLWKAFLMAPLPDNKEFWIAYDGERAIGRIGASFSDALANTGYFGFFDLDLDASPVTVADTLLAKACHYLKCHNKNKVIGPVNYNTWFPYRLRLPDQDPRLFAWEPVNPPKYLELILGAGFEITQQYHSTAFGNLPGFLEKTEGSYHRAVGAGFRFRRIGSEPQDKDIATFYQLSMASFRDSFMFEPIPMELFRQLYLRVTNKHKTTASFLLENADGVGVGLMFAFIDQWQRDGLNESYIVLKSLAISPEGRGQGLSNALTYLAVRDGIDKGADYAIAALVRHGIQSESYAKKSNLLWKHHYALMVKPL